MWDIKLKAINEQTKTQKHRKQNGGYQREGVWELQKREKGVKYIVPEEDLILGGEHTMQYTDDVSQNGTFETYITLLTNVTPINLVLKREKSK